MNPTPAPTLAMRLASFLPMPRRQRRIGEPCCIPGEIHFGTMPSASDGLILELSSTELLFREASEFLLDRTGRRVKLTFLTSRVEGTVVRCGRSGYVIRLATPLSPDDVGALLDEYGVEPSRR